MPAAGEISLAGRVAGVLWITGAGALVCQVFLPGVDASNGTAILVLATAAVIWGGICFVFPFERWGPIPFHLPATLALAFVAASVYFTGGAESSAFLLLFFLMAFVAYFFPPRVAAAYLAACAVVQALPLIYDGGAIAAGLLGEIAVAIPGYAVLGGFIVLCKAQLVRLREDAERLSLRDPLTGLANRRALMERLEGLGSRRAADVTGLLILDVDGLSEVNKLHGHPAGDRVLRAVAEAMRSATREEDLVARLGGDEFAVVAGSVTPTSMGRLAERVIRAVRAADERLDLPGYSLTASVGWALYPDDAGSVEGLMTRADGAERVAKSLGKNRAVAPPLASERVEVGDST